MASAGNKTFIASVPCVKRCVETLLSLKAHEALPGYLCILYEANAQNKTQDLKPNFKFFFDRYLRVGGVDKGKPYAVPFRRSSTRSIMFNANVAGSYAPSSIRPVNPLRQLVDIDGSATTYTLKDGHTAKAKELLLSGATIPAGALACFMHRDFGFIGKEPPSGSDLNGMAVASFGLPLDGAATIFHDDSTSFKESDFETLK